MRKCYYFKNFIISGAFDGDEDYYKLYKAYLEDEIGEEISVNLDADWYSIKPEYAVQFLAKESFSKAHTNELETKKIVIVEFEIDSIIRKVPLWENKSEEDEDTRPIEWHGTAYMRLRGLPLHVKHITRKVISTCDITTNKNGEVDSVTVEMEDIN